MDSPPRPAPSPLGRVLVNHLGFPCHAGKQVIVAGTTDAVFELQDMARSRASRLAGRDDFHAVLTGRLTPVDSALGAYSVGDFSAWTAPGIYRIALPETAEHSYQFAVTDGAFGWLPPMFLNFVRNWRSGPFENPWRGPAHLDDARRSDNGAPMNAVGGWYDAGDVRKWMVHSNLPALAFMNAHDRLPWHYAEWERVDPGWSPWLLEAVWGLDFMLKMQDPATGMFYEDVGGGGESRRREGMSWWYENHSGCYADNTENRFTDNEAGTGDERPVRIQYNPVAQFTSVAILARGARAYADLDPDRAGRYAAAAERGWRLGLYPDPACLESPGESFRDWTSVRSWRCIAACELHLGGRLPWTEVVAASSALLENFDPQLGFWRNTTGGAEPYRGILHSAQPIIALAGIARMSQDPKWRAMSVGVLRQCLERYVYPLAALTPFQFMPFGVYTQSASEGDIYRLWRDGYKYRFFMPAHHRQRINHGLAGHWTSWAHALALAGRLLEEPRCVELAWRQLHWLIGCNPSNSTVISGVGYNNPMPHSRYLGTFPGGFCNGFIGDGEDRPLLDLEGTAQWNSTEYWVTPLSNALMALSHLNAGPGPISQKLGRRERAPE
jgi:hypothetical protein